MAPSREVPHHEGRFRVGHSQFMRAGGGRVLCKLLHCPEGPSTQSSRTLVPKTINGMVFLTRLLKYWVLGTLWVCTDGVHIGLG